MEEGQVKERCIVGGVDITEEFEIVAWGAVVEVGTELRDDTVGARWIVSMGSP